MSTELSSLSVEKLVGRAVKEAYEGGSTQLIVGEIGARLLAIRHHGSGIKPLERALDGTPPTFTQLLDQLMEEMDAAGVADAQGYSNSIEAKEQEPHRARANDLRAMLEERYEKLSGGAALTLDGK